MADGGRRYGFSGGSGGSCSGGTTGGLTVSLRSEGKKMGRVGGGLELLFTVARQVGKREGDDCRGMERRGCWVETEKKRGRSGGEGCCDRGEEEGLAALRGFAAFGERGR
ncbi:hypothetical protein HAX54_016858 [Datura stramonium]|uniref:Uncharacterized protein n=1 Tax=Datura stramonium TaxID=4076 RepID=A0ABS8UJW5_DATST|nr:hypothetical protein [Datura stramonium]